MGPRGRGQMGGGEKPKNFRTAISRLVDYIKAYQAAIVIALLLGVLGAVLSLLGPGMIADITDLIQSGLRSGIDLSAIGRVAMTLVIFYILSFVFKAVQGFMLATVAQRVSKKMRSELQGKINRLPLAYFDRNSIGNTLSRVTNDVDTIGQTLNQSLGSLITAVTMFLGSLVMMFYTNWIMALSGVAATLIGFMLMSLTVSRSQTFFTRQQNELGALSGQVEETYTGHDIVKAYNGEEYLQTSFRKINSRLYESTWKSQFFSGLMQPFMSFIGNLGYVVVCITGALLAISGRIPFSVIVAFMMYIRLFTQPLTQIAQTATSLQSAAAASERVFEFLDEKELNTEIGSEALTENIRGDVEFRHVRFGYSPEKILIQDFNAEAKAGEKIAIVGPTGAGKTTMVNLLMRFYELNGGSILIDGNDTRGLSRRNVHDLFSMVLQDTWIFEGTIKENIAYSMEDVSDEEIIRACKATGFHHYITTLPEGYDTVLNERSSLSAGQRQLLTIARAMVRNAPMLILDEATSSVDTRTKIQIQQALDTLMKGRTSFIIAHRLSTIRNADLILVMRDGGIVESGTHEELMAKGGFYSDLYNSQFELTS